MSADRSTIPASGNRPSLGRRLAALFLGLSGTVGAAAGLGLVSLAVERRYPLGWLVGCGAVAFTGLVMIAVAVRLARLPRRRALIALLGSLLMVLPLARMARNTVADATVYAPGKRTMAEIRNLGIAIESSAVDAGGYPPSSSLDELARLLEGRYIQRVPRRDGWGNPLRYETADSGTERPYFIGSSGSDGKWQHPRLADYVVSSIAGDDVVYSNGGFVALPP